MTITLDLQQLDELGLRPDEYIYLECIRKGEHFSILEVEAKKLERQGYIKITDSGIVLRHKYLDLHELDEDTAWREFCNMYPFKVYGPNGNRILHTQDPDAQSNAKLKKKYLKIIKGKPYLHKKIMKALDIYLKKNRSNLAYLPNLQTFINNYGWEAYFHEIETKEDNSQKQKLYGGQFK